MSTPEERLSLAKKLKEIKDNILASNDKEQIMYYTKQVLQLAYPVQPNPRIINGKDYSIEGKARIISLLESELSYCEINNSADLETVHFQISASIAMLSLHYISGGISELNKL